MINRKIFHSETGQKLIDINVKGSTFGSVVSKSLKGTGAGILSASGARGSDKQAMQIVGVLGELKRDGNTNMNLPVTSNFYEGLSAFDVYMTAYSNREGFYSTSNKTGEVGYLTHNVVFEMAGTYISAESCEDEGAFTLGGKNGRFTLLRPEYEGVINDYTTLQPSESWLQQFVGRELKDSSILGHSRIEQSDLATLAQCKFHELEFEDETLTFTVDSLVGATLLSEMFNTDLEKAVSVSSEFYDELVDDGNGNLVGYKLNSEIYSLITKFHPRTINTDMGQFDLKYKFDQCTYALLKNKVTTEKSTKVVDLNGKPQNIVTDELVDKWEREGVEFLPVFSPITCGMPHGVCARCYGLSIQTGAFENIGADVGIGAAQSLSEPATQLTISSINNGGAAGNSLTDMSKVLNNLMVSGESKSMRVPNLKIVGATVEQESEPKPAIIAQEDCVVSVDSNKEVARVTIRPFGSEEEQGQQILVPPDCVIKRSTAFYKRGSVITSLKPFRYGLGELGLGFNAIVEPVLIKPDESVASGMFANTEIGAKYLYDVRRAQVNNIFYLYGLSNTIVDPRNVELLAMSQTAFVEDKGDLKESKLVNTIEGIASGGLDFKKVAIKPLTKSLVIASNSGLDLALSHEDIYSFIYTVINKGYTFDTELSNSHIRQLADGMPLEDIPSKLPATYKAYDTVEAKAEPEAHHEDFSFVESAGVADNISALLGFDMSAIPQPVEETEEPKVEEPKAEEAVEIEEHEQTKTMDVLNVSTDASATTDNIATSNSGADEMMLFPDDDDDEDEGDENDLFAEDDDDDEFTNDAGQTSETRYSVIGPEVMDGLNNFVPEHTSYSAGDTVIVALGFDPGYSLCSVSVTDVDGNSILCNVIGGNEIQFVMPENDVEVGLVLQNDGGSSISKNNGEGTDNMSVF